jgi:long-chain acyl-CoA synthetase
MESTSGPVASRPPSVARMLLDRVAATPDGEAFRHPVSGASGETWRSVSWQELGDRVRAVAAGLIDLGVQPEERVAIIAGTRLEWVLADLGIMSAGAATTTVYPSTQPDDVGYILADSAAVVVFAEDDAQLAKLSANWERLPELRAVVTFDDAGDGADVISLDELERRGRERLAANPGELDEVVAAIRPDSLATLIYTSGTTGRPKGVELIQDCWTYEGAAIDELGLLRRNDLQYLWLPLSHSFAKVLLAAQLMIGFSSAIDGRIDKIVDNLAVVRPTFMAGAPRIFEKVHARVVGMVEQEGGVRLRIFQWAFGVGYKVSRLRQQGRRPTGLLAAQHVVADRLVFHKLRERFGGRVRFFVSGSAALSREVAEWFHAAGVLVLEGYGLTESSAGSAVNLPDRYRLGTVGPPLPGLEVRIADDQEVLLRGPGVMRGYHGLTEQTAEALDSDGWLHTGDIGELDSDGFLRITDRKKDLIKTSGGKYVAPQPIEILFKVLCPLASQIVVHGDGRKYCTALVALDDDELAGWARAHELPETDHAALTKHEDVRAAVGAAIKELNARLNRWETIKDFRILDRDLTIEDGELTPSLKLKRRVVEDRYRSLLDEMYRSGTQ